LPDAEAMTLDGQCVADPVQSLRPAGLALFGAWLLFIGGSELLQRLWSEVDGTVVSSETSTGNRPITKYRLRAPGGHESEYVAGPTDASLPRRLPVGTVLHKERWHLSFSRDGNESATFSVLFYGSLILGGLGLEVVALKQWKLRKASRQWKAV